MYKAKYSNVCIQATWPFLSRYKLEITSETKFRVPRINRCNTYGKHDHQYSRNIKSFNEICCIVVFLYLCGRFSFFPFKNCILSSRVECKALWDFDMYIGTIRHPLTLRNYKHGFLYARVIDQSTADIFVKPGITDRWVCKYQRGNQNP